MAYEKQEWKCGDVVSADKLNHMEDGIANSGGGDILNVRATEKKLVYQDSSDKHPKTITNTYTDKTIDEVVEAISNGKICIFYEQEENTYKLKVIDNVEPPQCTAADQAFVTVAAVKEHFSQEGMTLITDDDPTADASTLIKTPL